MSDFSRSYFKIKIYALSRPHISLSKPTLLHFSSSPEVLVLSLMATIPSIFALCLIFLTLLLTTRVVVSQPVLDAGEQESTYRVLESINSAIPWRKLFPDDLCVSAPHGVVCSYFIESASAAGNITETAHITELSFGYVSDYSPNPPCAPDSAIDVGLLLSSFPYLRKLFFYKCFTGANVSMPDFSTIRSPLEELVFIENPSLVGSLGDNINSLTGLRRLVLTGTNVSGRIPDGFGDLMNLEQVTLSRNNFTGEISLNLSKLNKLKVLDLSQNGLDGTLPASIGRLPELLKLDLSSNRFSGKIPETLNGLKKLEFLDLSHNHFSKSGVPKFLPELPRLREVYLNGNPLGGQIPEIWEHMGGIIGIGLSGTELVGNIPVSMGVYLRNISCLKLDNNHLEGTVPEEFGALKMVNELNLENNNLSGSLPFSPDFVSKIGGKLKLQGNPHLCIDEGLRGCLGELKLCQKTDIPKSVFLYGGCSSNGFGYFMFLFHIFVGFVFLF